MMANASRVALLLCTNGIAAVVVAHNTAALQHR